MVTYLTHGDGNWREGGGGGGGVRCRESEGISVEKCIGEGRVQRLFHIDELACRSLTLLITVLWLNMMSSINLNTNTTNLMSVIVQVSVVLKRTVVVDID